MAEDSNTNDFIVHYLKNKAGVEGVDGDHIKEVIYESTKDSYYFHRQQERRQNCQEKANELLKQYSLLLKDKGRVDSLSREIEKEKTSLETSRNLKRVWAHFDLDMFFVACEIRDNPHLADKPVAVGNNSMISTANYVARKFGIRSAMPGFIGKKLCPELVLLDHHSEKYKESSKIFKSILTPYDSEFESMGLDEASLDLTNYLDTHKEQKVEAVCAEIRAKVFEAIGVTCSGGIGPNKMVAKIASDLNKPNGQYIIESSEKAVTDFMAKFSIRKIPGIGSVSETLLNCMGINTCQDLLENLLLLKISFSQSSFEFYLASALGLGRCEHRDYEPRKSISSSKTFNPTDDKEELIKMLRSQAKEVAKDLKEARKLTKHITVTIRTHKFETKNRANGLPSFTDDEETIVKASISAFSDLRCFEPLRLVGVKADELVEESDFALKIWLEKNSPKPKKEKASCPVCGHVFEFQNNSLINRHIDECLNPPPVQKEVASYKENSNTRRKRETLDIIDLKKISKKRPKKKISTLDSFFSKK